MFMSGAYVRATQDALAGFLNLLVRLALPLSILFGLTLIAVVIGYMRDRDSAQESLPFLKKGLTRAFGFVLVGLTFLVCWSALKQTRAVAVDALRWRDASESVANPTTDAPAVAQSGPVVAQIKERTFTKTINLPPNIGELLKTEGVQALRPYLPDSGSPDALGQADKLEQKGNLYTLARQVRQLEEYPVPFQDSDVKAVFKRIGGRAYEMRFQGTYAFKNPQAEPAHIRFWFPLPESGTVDQLEVKVGADRILQPSQNGSLEWSGDMKPGEARTAVVTYRVVGSKTWAYDIGSQRRRVEKFALHVEPNGPMKFLRGSLQPSQGGSNPAWSLSNVVTTQRVAVSFPTDAVARETFVQTLSMLPAALALFLFGTWLVAWRTREVKEPVLMALAVALFAFGLGGSTILAAYLGPLVGVFVSLGAGCLAVLFVLGPRSLLASIPAAGFAAAFMSPEHTGIIVAAILLVAMVPLLLVGRERAVA